jgi:glutamate--cysteine ligase
LTRALEQRLRRLASAGVRGILSGGHVGIEKESLRVTPDGHIAPTLHPRALGAALTNPYVTTDYSEALVEFRTPPLHDIGEVIDFLDRAHRFVYPHLGEELLWASSMPCIVGGDDSIPIAEYGRSNPGFMKHVYRRGLGYRYGKMMQVISGVHYNYSLPERFWPAFQEIEGSSAPLRQFVDDAYFGLIRNLQRVGWLVPYLFGASPAVCKSFLGTDRAGFKEFNRTTWYEPYATSLRMSDIGYRNTAPRDLVISYDDVSAYVESLTRAIETPYPPYERIGVLVDGEWRQLNANYLQIEAEYYGTVRAKHPPRPGEKPTLALKRRGVEYVELRSVDVNLFEPLGVTADQLRFLEALVLYCLLEDSPRVSTAEREEINYNQGAAAHHGRDPGLALRRDGGSAPLAVWASEVLEAVEAVCELLDEAQPEPRYMQALARQRELVREPEGTPSARLIAEMRAAGEGFYHAAMRLSQAHRDRFAARSLSASENEWFARIAQHSVEKQQTLEAQDDVPFEEYLRRYFAQR